MTQLKSNNELIDCLVQLAGELQQLNENSVANELLHASQFHNGSPSEFLHEAHCALINAKAICKRKLYAIQLENIDVLIKQIDSAFKQIGGA